MASARDSFVLGSAFAVAVLAALASAIGCNDDNQTPAQQAALAAIQSCENVSTGCPSNIAPLPADMTACSNVLDGPCAGQAVTFQSCVMNKCTDAGFIDYGAIEIDCTGYQAALESCLAPDGGTDEAVDASGGTGVVVITTTKDAAARD